MAVDTHNQHGAGGAAGFEPDRPPTSGIGVFVFLVLIGIIVVFYAVIAFVKGESESRRLGVDSGQAEIREQLDRAANESLTSYGAVDEAGKVYRIPVQQAKAAVLKDPALLGKLPRLLPEPTPGGAGN